MIKNLSADPIKTIDFLRFAAWFRVALFWMQISASFGSKENSMSSVENSVHVDQKRMTNLLSGSKSGSQHIDFDFLQPKR